MARRPVGIRLRTTLAATLVSAVVLAVAGTALVLVQRHLLRDAVADLAVRQASDVASQASTQGSTARDLVALVHSEDGVVQIVDDTGHVLAASDPIEESGPVVAARPAPGDVVTVVVDGLPEEHHHSYVVAAKGVTTPDGDAVVLAAQSLQTAQRATELAVLLSVVGLPMVVLLIGLVSYWLTGRALAPVRAMTDRVGEITARDLSARVPVSPAGDEISRLAETMNAMLERLQASSARQRRFVADASHELRSPLAVIRASQEIALAHPEAADWPDTGRDTLVELERLEKLVSDLLLLARFDDHDSGAAYTDVDLDDIVGSEVVRLRKVTSLQVEATTEPVRVLGDQHQLSRLVRNLVDNAVAHATSTVGLALSRDDGEAVIEVCDDGPGIAGDDRERVFERFVRLDESRTRDTGGAGVGLSIVREIARRHGGDVIATTGRGRTPGARFVVRLPAR